MQIPTELLIAMVTSGCAMIASIIGALMNYQTSIHQRDAETNAEDYRQAQTERENRRDQIDHERACVYDSLMKGVSASLSANAISLIALQHGHLNGNVEEAAQEVKDAQADLEATQRKAVAHLTN